MADFEQLRCDIQNYLHSLSTQPALGRSTSFVEAIVGKEELQATKLAAFNSAGSPEPQSSPKKMLPQINIQQLMFSLIQIFYINEEIKQIRELGFTTVTEQSPLTQGERLRDSQLQSEKDQDGLPTSGDHTGGEGHDISNQEDDPQSGI